MINDAVEQRLTRSGRLHRNLDLLSQLALAGCHGLPQLRQQATCLVAADLAQRAGEVN